MHGVLKDYAHLMKMVVGLSGTLGDPGGLMQTDFALGKQRVGRLLAAGSLY